MDLERLIDNLNGPDEADRLYAAQDLGEVNDSAAVAALAGRLGVEPSRAVKETIFHALGRIQDDSVLPTAIGLIEADDAFVRNEAMHLLSTFGPRAMPALAQAIGSDDCDVRKFALDAMAMIDSDLKDDLYRQVLRDADINLVITAVEHIGRDNKVALRECVESVLERASHPMLVAACVDAIGQIGNAGSLDAMFRKLGGYGMSEFHAAGFIRSVGRLGGEAHVDLLCRLIERFPAAQLDAGLDAIEAICCRASQPLAPPTLLTTVLSIAERCCDPMARYKAVRILGVFASDPVREVIRQYLESQDKMVRLAAVESIARWDASSMRDLLTRRIVVETDEDVRDAIRDAVGQHVWTAA